MSAHHDQQLITLSANVAAEPDKSEWVNQLVAWVRRGSSSRQIRIAGLHRPLRIPIACVYTQVTTIPKHQAVRVVPCVCRRRMGKHQELSVSDTNGVAPSHALRFLNALDLRRQLESGPPDTDVQGAV